jgi:hypothetical protein
MDLQDYTTQAGTPASEIRARLADPFDDPKAYKKVEGTGADLTDINTGHMLQRLNDVFGMKGLGWNLLYDRDDIEAGDGGSRILVRLKYAEFVFWLHHGDGDKVEEIRIPTSGANFNTPQYAEEGAKTVALGTALKGLGFQEAVYTGHLNHRNAGSYRRKAPSRARKRDDNGRHSKASIKKASKAKAKKPEPDGNGDLGSYQVPFGKHKGKTLADCPPDYLEWVVNEMSPFGDEGVAFQKKAEEYLSLAAA